MHQFCRVGAHAFMGGYTVATKDVLPVLEDGGEPRAASTASTPSASPAAASRAETDGRASAQAYRVLLQSRLNTTEALARLEAGGRRAPEVRTLVEFIRSSPRGVILKRRAPARRAPTSTTGRAGAGGRWG